MKHTIFSRSGFLEVQTSEDANLIDMLEMLAAVISHSDFRAGANLLIDHTRLNAGPMTAADVHAAADKVSALRAEIGRMRCAHLVSRDLEFGLVRMWEAYVDGRWDGSAECFRSRLEAISWLGADRAEP
jgi:hypothetical protein